MKEYLLFLARIETHHNQTYMSILEPEVQLMGMIQT